METVDVFAPLPGAARFRGWDRALEAVVWGD